jgi:hypothetical protein
LPLNSAQDIAFSFDVKKAAMGPHIGQKWGWDEEYQSRFISTISGKNPFCD